MRMSGTNERRYFGGTNEAVYRFKRYTYVGGGRTPTEMMMYLAKSPGIFVAVAEVDVGRYNVASQSTGGNEKIQSPLQRAAFIPYVPNEISKRNFRTFFLVARRLKNTSRAKRCEFFECREITSAFARINFSSSRKMTLD